MSSYAARDVALGAALWCVTGLVPAQSPDGIASAIEQLGSESAVDRANARKAILAMGEQGLAALRRSCSVAKDVPAELLFVIAEDLARERRSVVLTQCWDLGERGWCLQWRHDGTRLALLQKLGGAVRFFDAEWQPTNEQFGKDAGYFALAPVGDGYAFNEGVGNLVIVPGHGKEQVNIVATHRPSIAYSPDGKLIATAEYANSVDLLRVADGERIAQFAIEGTRGGLTTLFSPDGKLLVVGNRNDKTHVFDVDRGEVKYVLDRKQSHQPVFSPDGKYLAVAYVDGKIAIWNVATGKLVKLLDGEAAEVFTLAWSRDGRFFASAGHKGPIVIWSGKHLAKLHTIDSGSDRTFQLAFRPDGKALVATGNKTTRAWTIAVNQVPRLPGGGR